MAMAIPKVGQTFSAKHEGRRYKVTIVRVNKTSCRVEFRDGEQATIPQADLTALPKKVKPKKNQQLPLDREGKKIAKLANASAKKAKPKARQEIASMPVIAAAIRKAAKQKRETKPHKCDNTITAWHKSLMKETDETLRKLCKAAVKWFQHFDGHEEALAGSKADKADYLMGFDPIFAAGGVIDFLEDHHARGNIRRPKLRPRQVEPAKSAADRVEPLRLAHEAATELRRGGFNVVKVSVEDDVPNIETKFGGRDFMIAINQDRSAKFAVLPSRRWANQAFSKVCDLVTAFRAMYTAHKPDEKRGRGRPKKESNKRQVEWA